MASQKPILHAACICRPARTQVPAGARVQHLHAGHERDGVVMNLQEARTTDSDAFLSGDASLLTACLRSTPRLMRRLQLLRCTSSFCFFSIGLCSHQSLGWNHLPKLLLKRIPVLAVCMHAATKHMLDADGREARQMLAPQTVQIAGALTCRSHLNDMLWVHRRIEARPTSPCKLKSCT